MKILNNEEMLAINGGAWKVITGIFAVAVTFFIGVYNGFANRKKCK